MFAARCITWLSALALVATVLSAGKARADDDVTCDPSGEKFCQVKATGLPLRLLPKPGAHLYVDKDENSATSGDLRPFSVLYAFAEDGVNYDANFKATGWYRAGHGAKSPDGWVKADDVVPWKQALALAYTNPGPAERKPVLMFENHDALKKTLNDIKGKTITPVAIYDQIAGNKIPAGIISREPNAWVDIDRTFYLLPILQYEKLEPYAPDLLGLQLAALTNQGKAQQTAACNLQKSDANQCFREQAGPGTNSLKADVVFVVDTTNSMQGNIDAVRVAISKTAQTMQQQIANPDALKFGIVDYRDDLRPETGNPDLEYLTKNFTPDLLPADKFEALMDSGAVKAAAVGSGDWPEEVFAGVRDGIKSNWTAKAAHILVLIGDASSHPVGHPKNTTGLSEVALKQLAKENNVYIASIYVKEPSSGVEQDLVVAKPQFEGLATGDKDNGLAFSVVLGNSRIGNSAADGSPTGEEGQNLGLEEALKAAFSKIVNFIGTGKFDSIVTSNTAADDTTGQAVLSAVRAAFVDYIGSGAKPPPNIVAWVVDRDLTDFEKKSFDVRVAVRRGEIQELQSALTTILNKFRSSEANSLNFLQQVQLSSTASSYDLKISDTEKVANSPLVPLWIKSLPYKSDALALSYEEFKNEAADDRAKFEAELEKKIAFYDDIMNRPEAWVRLDPQGSDEDKVFMLELKDLP